MMNLHVVAMKQVGAFKGDGPWDDDLKDIETVYLRSSGEFLVGLVDGKIVAMGAFRPTGEHEAEIKRMRVHPEWQGHGFGQIILSALESHATSMGYRRLHLETSIIQVAAQALYRRNGFREIGRAVIDGFDCILFEKILGE